MGPSTGCAAAARHQGRSQSWRGNFGVFHIVGVYLPNLGVYLPNLGVYLPNFGVYLPNLGVYLPISGDYLRILVVSMP